MFIINFVYFLLSIFIVFFWRGVWLFQDKYEMEWYISIIIGIIGMLITSYIYVKMDGEKKPIEQIASPPVNI